MNQLIKDLEARKKELEEAIEREKQRVASYTPEMHLAEALHATKTNHEDDWSYENWDGSTHKRYLKCVRRVTEIAKRLGVNVSAHDYPEQIMLIYNTMRLV